MNVMRILQEVFIKAAEGGNKTVVVVIGAGHKSGIINYLKNPKTYTIPQ